MSYLGMHIKVAQYIIKAKLEVILDTVESVLCSLALHSSMMYG